MTTTILITGSTDGIGFEAAKRLALGGHHLILHGRNPAKLDHSVAELEKLVGAGKVDAVVADLSRPVDVAAFADRIATQFELLDVLINNAGVFQTPDPITVDDLDLRFAVNTIAPYVLTRRLLPLMPTTGRVINLSSAAQAPVDPAAVEGTVRMPAGEAYAQSKLALTMWSRHLAESSGRRSSPSTLVHCSQPRWSRRVTGSQATTSGSALTFSNERPCPTSSRRHRARTTTTTPVASPRHTPMHSTPARTKR